MKLYPSVLEGAVARANARVDARKAVKRQVIGGSVVFCPVVNGAVRIIGLDANGEWVAEFSCLERDYSESYVHRMERHVAMKSGRSLTLMG